jgi:hypothetical protein
MVRIASPLHAPAAMAQSRMRVRRHVVLVGVITATMWCCARERAVTARHPVRRSPEDAGMLPGAECGDGMSGPGPVFRFTLVRGRALYVRPRTQFSSMWPPEHSCEFFVAFGPDASVPVGWRTTVEVARPSQCAGDLYEYDDDVVELRIPGAVGPRSQREWSDSHPLGSDWPDRTVWLRVRRDTLEHLRGAVVPQS